MKNKQTKIQKQSGAIIIEGHVQGLSNTRSLGEAGIPVYVVDKNNCIARYSKYCEKFFFCPDFEIDDLAFFLINLAKKEQLQNWLLLPSNDHAVYTISKNKTDLEQYFKVITPDIDIIDNIYDKAKLLSVARKNEVPIPNTHYFKDPEEDLPERLAFPVITKGRYGLSFYKALGKKALVANNAGELRKQLKYIDDKYDIKYTLTQEVIPDFKTNKTVSFTAFCINGVIKTFWMGIKLREHPVQFGTGTLAKSIYIPECYNQSLPLLKSLHYTGVCEIEYLKDPSNNRYKLIEINARTWLWVGLAKACGIDYAKIVYNYLNNLKNTYPNAYDTNAYWINGLTDPVFSLKAIIAGQISLISYLKTIFKNKVRAVFHVRDPIPATLFPFLTILRARKIL